MPRKWQTLKNVCASNFDLNWGESAAETFKMLKVILERRQWKELVLSGFLSLKVV
jgi:hypothetical protein